MNEPSMLAFAGLAGLALGAIFFGGLWWTVQRVVCSPRPALWVVGSGLLRVGVVLAGFYFIGREHWDRLLFCLLGFVAARLLVTRLARSQAQPAGSGLANK